MRPPLTARTVKDYFVVDGEVVVEPLVPPLPTVPELEPPTPVLPEPELVPAPAPPVVPAAPLAPAAPEAPVLASRSCRHLSFCVWSVSFSQLALAATLSEVPPETLDPVVAEPEAPFDELVESVEGDELMLGLDGEVVLELPEV